MRYIIHPAQKRGGGDYSWLKTRYSFSFSSWHDNERMSFGKLRVLNDDIVAPKSGFPTHQHANFEIVTIVMSGVLTHQDSMGNAKEVREGEVQVMSAGSGVVHSEMNNTDKELQLFQLWIEPDKHGVATRYDQKSFDTAERRNMWQIVVAAGNVPKSLMIHQNVRISLAEVSSGKPLSYIIAYPQNAAYLFVIKGSIIVAGVTETLNDRDAVGIWNTDQFIVTAKNDASLLLIEVPLGEAVERGS